MGHKPAPTAVPPSSPTLALVLDDYSSDFRKIEIAKSTSFSRFFYLALVLWIVVEIFFDDKLHIVHEHSKNSVLFRAAA